FLRFFLNYIPSSAVFVRSMAFKEKVGDYTYNYCRQKVGYITNNLGCFFHRIFKLATNLRCLWHFVNTVLQKSIPYFILFLHCFYFFLGFFFVEISTQVFALRKSFHAFKWHRTF